jgi:hypothetical protein
LRASPQTPWVGFAEILGSVVFCEAEQALFAFSGKRRNRPIRRWVAEAKFGC